jgi:tripartite-type tricarboxylate transporter receptor subunit TctC
MFRSAPKDGSAMAIITQNIAIEEALKNKAVQYKSNEFNWIGRATSNTEIHVLSTKSPGHTIDGAKKHETPVASTGPGSPSDSYPRLHRRPARHRARRNGRRADIVEHDEEHAHELAD